MHTKNPSISADQHTRRPILAAISFNPFIIKGMKPLDLPFRTTPQSAPLARAKGANRARPLADLHDNVIDNATPQSPLPTMDDEGVLRDCVLAVSRLDQLALAKLYDLTVSRVYSVALRIVRHAHLAEEVVSDVYMQVWRDAPRYDVARGRVLGWLLIISRSRALDILRRQDEAFSHPEPYDLIAEPESSEKTAHDLLAAAQAGTALREAMESLTPLQRQLLSLAFFRGLSHTEIVEHSGIPLGTVKTHIRRALTVLRDQLGCAAQFDTQLDANLDD
jgi:RNA polymerase sigma factor (sigma-70 family)